MARRPYCKWFTSDWLSSGTRAAMTLEQRAIYRDALDICYQEGSIPDDPLILQRQLFITPDEFDRNWPAVRKHFKVAGEGCLTHHRVELDTAEQLAFGAKQAARARARWGDDQPPEMPDSCGKNAAGIISAMPDGCGNNAAGINPASKKLCRNDAGTDAGMYATPSSSSSSSSSSSPTPKPKPKPEENTLSSISVGNEQHTDRPKEAAPEFDAWYQTYPRKVARKAAEKAFAKIKKQDLELLKANTPRWAEEFERRGSKYVPHPATFLNREDWRDPPPEFRADPKLTVHDYNAETLRRLREEKDVHTPEENPTQRRLEGAQ